MRFVGGSSASAIGTSTKTPEVLAGSERGELISILLAEGQPQLDAAFDRAPHFVLCSEFLPLVVGLVVVMEECLKLPSKVVCVVGFPWGCAGSMRRCGLSW